MTYPYGNAPWVGRTGTLENVYEDRWSAGHLLCRVLLDGNKRPQRYAFSFIELLPQAQEAFVWRNFEAEVRAKRDYIQSELDSGNSVRALARELGMSNPTLYKYMRELGIDFNRRWLNPG